MIGRHFWTLMRRFGENESIFFPIVVEVEEDEFALFGATILGLETSLVAMGRSPEEARERALSLFKRRVDFALRENRPLSEELGNRIAFRRLNVDFKKATQLLDDLLTVASSTEEWGIAPTGTSQAPTSQAA